MPLGPPKRRYRRYCDSACARAVFSRSSPERRLLHRLGREARRPGGGVYAVEPLAEMAEAVRSNARLNGFSQVEVFEAAVADREGQELLVEGASPLEGHLGAPGRATPHRAVRVTTVDALTRRRGVRAPTVVKMDVEGAEERAVQGMRETLTVAQPIVICELHGRQSRVPALLGDLGYSVNFAESGASRNPGHWNPHIAAMPGSGSRVAVTEPTATSPGDAAEPPDE
jgi:FkbM family methyltransferase